MKSKIDVYEVITGRIIEQLEKGVIPWRKEWKTAGGGLPMNLISKKHYRGINVFMLLCAGFNSPYWLSYKQAKELGGQVRKGEKGFPVVYWNFVERQDKETGEIEKIPFIRYSTVFNTDQIDGLESKLPKVAEEPREPVCPVAAAVAIVEGMPNKPEIRHGGGRAFYRPADDLVGMPERDDFSNGEAYHSTLFHELVHSTGHAKRLSRPGIMETSLFGSTTYSKEELVAEMGAAFLCGHAGIVEATLENSAAYIGGWLKKLRDDKKLVIQAASMAQKAAEFILGKPEEPAKGEEPAKE